MEPVKNLEKLLEHSRGHTHSHPSPVLLTSWCQCAQAGAESVLCLLLAVPTPQVLLLPWASAPLLSIGWKKPVVDQDSGATCAEMRFAPQPTPPLSPAVSLSFFFFSFFLFRAPPKKVEVPGLGVNQTCSHRPQPPSVPQLAASLDS